MECTCSVKFFETLKNKMLSDSARMSASSGTFLCTRTPTEWCHEPFHPPLGRLDVLVLLCHLKFLWFFVCRPILGSPPVSSTGPYWVLKLYIVFRRPVALCTGLCPGLNRVEKSSCKARRMFVNRFRLRENACRCNWLLKRLYSYPQTWRLICSLYRPVSHT
jgi:hypothetical protein